MPEAMLMPSKQFCLTPASISNCENRILFKIVTQSFLDGTWLKEAVILVFSRLQHQVKKHNLVVASYDVVRNDIDFFKWVLFHLNYIFILLLLCSIKLIFEYMYLFK